MQRSSAKARFLKHTHEQDGCLVWTGCKNHNGYGRFNLANKAVSAHRAAFALFVGSIPRGLWVLHRCTRPSCVNPKHLYLGTAKQNTADMLAAGRGNHQRKKQCPQGHPYSGRNLQMWGTWRYCKACNRKQVSTRNARQKKDEAWKIANARYQRERYQRMKEEGLFRCWRCGNWQKRGAPCR